MTIEIAWVIDAPIPSRIPVVKWSVTLPGLSLPGQPTLNTAPRISAMPNTWNTLSDSAKNTTLIKMMMGL